MGKRPVLWLFSAYLAGMGLFFPVSSLNRMLMIAAGSLVLIFFCDFYLKVKGNSKKDSKTNIKRKTYIHFLLPVFLLLGFIRMEQANHPGILEEILKEETKDCRWQGTVREIKEKEVPWIHKSPLPIGPTFLH